MIEEIKSIFYRDIPLSVNSYGEFREKINEFTKEILASNLKAIDFKFEAKIYTLTFSEETGVVLITEAIQ